MWHGMRSIDFRCTIRCGTIVQQWLLSLGIKLPHVQLVGVGTSALHAVGQMGRRYAQHRMRPECGTVVAVVLPCGDQVCTQLHVRAEYGTASLTKPFAQTADGS